MAEKQSAGHDAQGLTDSSFAYHLASAKKNGVTQTEIAEILTHAAFYIGWPKAWAAFRMAKKIRSEDEVPGEGAHTEWFDADTEV